jgi:hypothetical protein
MGDKCGCGDCGQGRIATCAMSRGHLATRQVAPGGRCQWVLDAAFQVVEWPGQPLRFESVVLRTALDLRRCAILLLLER